MYRRYVTRVEVPTFRLRLWGEPPVLTAELHSDEVLEAQVLQEDPRGGAGLEVEGDVGAQLCLEGGEVEVRGLLVERGGVPRWLCRQTEGVKVKQRI